MQLCLTHLGTVLVSVITIAHKGANYHDGNFPHQSSGCLCIKMPRDLHALPLTQIDSEHTPQLYSCIFLDESHFHLFLVSLNLITKVLCKIVLVLLYVINRDCSPNKPTLKCSIRHCLSLLKSVTRYTDKDNSFYIFTPH